MLKSTFLHIPYVNEAIETKLWKNHIFTWEDFLSSSLNIPNRKLVENYLKISLENYEKKNYEFFAKRMLSRYHWRAYDDFKDNCCFLDIETTGLGKDNSDITVIGLFDGKESKVFIHGINMDEFTEEIKKYSFIVTFNGALFDVPFIRAKFPQLRLNQFHADLRFILRNLGYTGGLKKIEKNLGIERDSDLAGLNGYDAVKLWHKYKLDNDKAALDKLVRYNIEDIENLKTLMEFSYSKLKERCISCGDASPGLVSKKFNQM